ncbi:MAG: glycosyltransferase family 4 protein [Flaviaesturariibacter sp.]|nr:glycosyltransferase family 4 protein [Flaviaesturariibacter sp.]
MKRLVFTVTNELTFDQRMIRICTSLQNAGYQVLLVGRKYSSTAPLQQQPFAQKRIACFFKKGAAFYLEYNIRLFFYLLFKKSDLLCAIDLDTILPCLFASKIRGTKRVYDAHELFCEMKEIVTRKKIYKVWKGIEKFAVPRFTYGYTVNEEIQQIFKREYNVDYKVIRSISVLRKLVPQSPENFIIYQGAVNEGRSFETLIPAFKYINTPLHIYGDGNFFDEAKQLIKKYGLEEKVYLMGKLKPDQLREVTPKALFGITLFENNGLSNYYSLANRFFDYIHAGIPQLCVKYPVYKRINEQFEVAFLTEDLSSESLSKTINSILADTGALTRLRQNCVEARKFYNWQTEEKKLLDYYKEIFE